MPSDFTKKLILLLFLLLFFPAVADVVKPALIEISVNKKGEIDVEIRASIEALLTGINGKYKNTKDAPNADEYDDLRKMQSEELMPEFDKFRSNFLQQVKLTDDDKNIIPLNFKKVDIPEPGYTKVPRISLIRLAGQVDLSVTSIQWYYPMAFGDNAVRLRQVDAENSKWHWSEWQWLKKDEPSTELSLTEIIARKPIHQTVGEYIILGFEHILPKGLDHILFILEAKNVSIVSLTDDSFEQDVIKSSIPVLVDYWAEWCGPCKSIAPILEEIAAEYEGKVIVAKLNIDDNGDTPPKYGIRGIPTLMLFKNGEVEATKVGALNKSQLTAFLDQNI
ncbi:Thioredoxin [Nymphon striatum]|nr:Thioredoxin [Nymphon striatum]